MSVKNMKKLVVIDGNSLANRAFYAIPVLSNSKGVITNAVYGFSSMLMRIIKQEQPDFLAVAFDVSRKVFRHERYPEYKAQRKGMPEELRGQMDLIKEVLRAMNIAIYELAGYEGDDVIGSMVRWAEARDIESVILTGDKDSFQLITDKTSVHFTRRGISDLGLYDYETFQKEYDLVPDQVRDLKGLMGDTSDNIPGVPGVGEKTALKLLHQYGTVEEVYEHLEDFKGKKLGEKLSENKEKAFMSKELATIDCHIPMEFDEDTMKLERFAFDKLIPLYKELELKGLLRDLTAMYPEEFHTDLSEQEESLSDTTSKAGILVESPEQLEAIVKQTEDLKNLNIIVETTPGNIKTSRVTTIGFMTEDQPYCISCGEKFPIYAKILKDWLEDEEITVITDDAKKLTAAFLPEGIEVDRIIWDSTLSAYLLNPEGKDFSVAAQMEEEYNLIVSEEGAERVYDTLKAIYILSDPIVERMEREELLKLYAQIELPLSGLLTRMEYEGIRIDTDYLMKLGTELSDRIGKLTKKLYEAAGEEFNLNSSKQLGVVLFEKLGLPVIKKTKTGYSTDAEVLDTLAQDYDFVKDILEYRQLTKLNSTYIEGILKLVDPETSKVHTTFNQTITATGRLSSTEPNLQNIPVKTEEGKRIRKAFLPSKPGNVLVSADYSQIELRILAHMSKDPVLVQSFMDDEDIHRRTASEVFGVPMDEVTTEQRRNAKAVNFGIVYGQTEFGLSKELGISRKEAKNYIESYFDRYSGVKEYIAKAIHEARETGFSTTMMGRKRYIKDINSKNFNLRSFAERTAVNTPIQGTAADVIKMAMLQVQDNLIAHDFSAKMLLQVHDELIFEVPPQEIASLIIVLRECMEHAVELDVPLKIDVNVGFNWYDMEQV